MDRAKTARRTRAFLQKCAGQQAQRRRRMNLHHAGRQLIDI
jgi:hypothetical protein